MTVGRRDDSPPVASRQTYCIYMRRAHYTPQPHAVTALLIKLMDLVIIISSSIIRVRICEQTAYKYIFIIVIKIGFVPTNIEAITIMRPIGTELSFPVWFILIIIHPGIKTKCFKYDKCAKFTLTIPLLPSIARFSLLKSPLYMYRTYIESETLSCRPSTNEVDIFTCNGWIST